MNDKNEGRTFYDFLVYSLENRKFIVIAGSIVMLAFISVWAFTHWNAKPGEPVSVFNIIYYTKKDSSPKYQAKTDDESTPIKTKFKKKDRKPGIARVNHEIANSPLRSQPLTIRKKKARNFFELNRNWGPTKWIRNDFKVRGDVVIDRTTGLMWQRSSSDKPVYYSNLLNHFEKMNRGWFAGYDDWRLPTAPELMSLWEAEKQSNGLFLNQVFEGQQQSFLSADKDPTGEVWVVGFNYPKISLFIPEDTWPFWVRAVRTIK